MSQYSDDEAMETMIDVELGGGHSVVVVRIHDDLAIDPLSQHLITRILVDYSLIPPRRSLESVAQCRTREGGHSVVGVHLTQILATYPISYRILATVFVERSH